MLFHFRINFITISIKVINLPIKILQFSCFFGNRYISGADNATDHTFIKWKLPNSWWKAINNPIPYRGLTKGSTAPCFCAESWFSLYLLGAYLIFDALVGWFKRTLFYAPFLCVQSFFCHVYSTWACFFIINQEMQPELSLLMVVWI